MYTVSLCRSGRRANIYIYIHTHIYAYTYIVDATVSNSQTRNINTVNMEGSHWTYYSPVTYTSSSHSTRWFKYGRDKLSLVYTQIVPVIFEPPCTSQKYPYLYYPHILSSFYQAGILQKFHPPKFCIYSFLIIKMITNTLSIMTIQFLIYLRTDSTGY